MQSVGVAILDRYLIMQSSRVSFRLLQTDAVDANHKERRIRIALYFGENDYLFKSGCGEIVTPVVVSPVMELVLNRTDKVIDDRVFIVDMTLNRNVIARNFELRIYDVEDDRKPIIKENVTNNTTNFHYSDIW